MSNNEGDDDDVDDVKTETTMVITTLVGPLPRIWGFN